MTGEPTALEKQFFPETAPKPERGLATWPHPEPINPPRRRSAEEDLPGLLKTTYQEIRKHTYKNPITKRQLQQILWGVGQTGPEDPEREVRLYVEKLVREYGLLVCSGPKGFYLAEEEYGFKKGMSYIKTKILSMQDRVRIMEENYKLFKGELPVAYLQGELEPIAEDESTSAKTTAAERIPGSDDE